MHPQPNHANYDEALANPFPELPPLFVCNDGIAVRTCGEWMSRRRPELIELFEREVLGRVPAETPADAWQVLEEKEIEAGGIPIIERRLEGVVDNSRCPDIDVRIALRVGVPKNAEMPVPVLIIFSGFGFPRPGAAPPAGFRPPGPAREEILANAGSLHFRQPIAPDSTIIERQPASGGLIEARIPVANAPRSHCEMH